MSKKKIAVIISALLLINRLHGFDMADGSKYYNTHEPQSCHCSQASCRHESKLKRNLNALSLQNNGFKIHPKLNQSAIEVI